MLGPTVGDAVVFIANAGRSDGTATVRGAGSELRVDGDMIVGNAFTDVDTGQDGFATTGTLGIFGGGLVSVMGNMIVGQDDADAIGLVTVSGMSTLDIGQSLTVGTGLGMGSLTILNGGRVEADTGITIGANGTLTAGSGSLGGATFELLNDGGTITLGAAPGVFEIDGDFTQTGGTLDLLLDSGGAFIDVAGIATLTSGTINLTRQSLTQFGDSLMLAAAGGLTLGAVVISEPSDGLELHTESDGNTVRYTTITDGTPANTTPNVIAMKTCPILPISSIMKLLCGILDVVIFAPKWK